MPPFLVKAFSACHYHLFCLTARLPLLSSFIFFSHHPSGRPLPPTSSSSLLPPSLPSSSSAPHHPSPGPSPPIRECQVPLLEKNSAHSHLEPHPEDSYMLRAQSSATGAANHHNQSTLRPPLPPPHNHQSLSHQSANSLNRNTLRGGRNPIHAPTPGTGDGPTTPESVQLQDSWVLNSNVPLETRSEHMSSLLLSFVFNG
ncbi:Teneurin-2 [Takifugu flavidus]|uniref:Teneurin-2 n=1 Tax=Takifugu flavidus TaxID=433684 RepID=A0A5C6MKN5_9TELE|nr:Teneurin-2 [Takifugu flavidus]